MTRLVGWMGISRGKFFDWRERYGKVNEHNAMVPRDHWLEEWEQQAILAYLEPHPLEGYRRLTFMMLDENVVAVSPATSVIAFSTARGCWIAGSERPRRRALDSSSRCTRTSTGTSTYVIPELGWTFYYLCSVLDGCSRAIVHWDL